MSILDDLNNIFDDVKENPDTGFDNIPDGEYLSTIEKAEYKESKKGKPMIQITLVVAEGKYKKRYDNMFMMLQGNDADQTRQNLSRMVIQLQKLGIDTSQSLQHTLDQLPDLAGSAVVHKVKTNVAKNGNEWRNVSLELPDETDAPIDITDDEDDENPFIN